MPHGPRPLGEAAQLGEALAAPAGQDDAARRPLASAVVVAGYVTAFFLLSRVLARGLALGVAYGIWSAIGVTLVSVIGAVWFGDRLTWAQIGGIALVAAGVLALELGRAH
ncbi:DMT family transporter [Streptomyces ehimensis]|uniref:DMT family transporter n=1 Tax=Streptomyces ehimensis TaxID=68195 RepID=A0ABV9BT45_9ACTN